MNTIEQWLQQATTRLRSSCNTDTPELDAQLLVCHVLNLGRATLYAFPERQVSPRQWQSLETLLSRRLHGEPLAYITGTREFWSTPLSVKSGVLVPRPDTEILVERALILEQDAPPGYIVDLGTGSGAIAIAMATELPQRQFIAIERSARALSVAATNISNLDAANIQLVQASWVDCIGNDSIAMVLANPPYLANSDPHLATLQHEPVEALVSGNSGLEDLEHIIVETRRAAMPGAPLILEHGSQQGQTVRQIMHDNGYDNVRTTTDLAGLERVSVGVVPTLDIDQKY